MNGQQLTNSSNSANGTPSSSYPGSLSSQSSRDPSPATRVRKPLPEPFNHVNSFQGKSPGPNPTPLHSSPAPVPKDTHPAHAEFEDLQSSIVRPTSGAANHPRPFPNYQPSSQPMTKFPPPTSLPPSSVASFPTSLANNTPQVNNALKPTNHQNYPNHQISQPPEPSRPMQNPLKQQSFNLNHGQTQYQPLTNQPYSQHPNQFQKPSFQQPPNQPTMVAGQAIQNPSKPFPPMLNQTSQPLNRAPPSQNQYSQPNNPQGHFQNQSVQQPNTYPQPPNQYAQPPNKLSYPPDQIPQTPFSQPSSQLGQPPYSSVSQNQFSQPVQFSKPPGQIFQPPNQVSQPPKQISQPPNHYPQSNQYPSQQVPTQMPQIQHTNASNLAHQNQYPGSGYPQSNQASSNQFNKRYPPASGYQPQPGSIDGVAQHMAGMTVQQGFNKLWGMDTIDLLKCRDVLPKEKIEPPHVRLQHELYESANCSPEIFRSTLSKIPETKSLLDKSRLPLGVLVHPFKDLNVAAELSEEDDNTGLWSSQETPKQLSVIQCTVIVRCRMCRTYINPFVYFVDNKRWKCNLCFRVNELPKEFQFDPMTKTYGDPSRRPEIKSATIEFIAPSEYMVRPPQPAVYVFALDVSRLACECGYLEAVTRTLLAELDNIPGDARASVAFITYDSAVHFYSLAEGQAQPHQMTVVDVDDVFLPTPDNLLVNLHDCRDLIRDLLERLPEKYQESYDTHSALGAALQAAYKLLAPTGGRVTVFQSCLPNAGPGALAAREDPAHRAGDNPPHLNPATDFYKKLALECSGQQVAVDIFLVNSQYVDLATLSGVSRFSGGCLFHVPLYRKDRLLQVDTLQRMLQRYLNRKIGFESVMRLRCTRGLSIHTFHGNFFVRSTDLLSLPNANPDAGFGMQVTIEENLTEIQNVCFQAALLYTSSKGERRIRVHTLCLPVASTLPDILHGADQQCIAGLLAKMAVDRAVQSSLSDAREAFVNVVADVLSAFRLTQSSNTVGLMLAPASLRLLPLYILALLKHVAFRVGQSTRLDDRVFAMCQMKSLPLSLLMQSIYPDLYPLHNIEQQPEVDVGDQTVPNLPRLQLSAERIDSHGVFLLDDGASLLVYVGHNLAPHFCQALFDVPNFAAINHEMYSLPELENPASEAVRTFITYIQSEKPYPSPLQVIRDDSHYRMKFLERLIEDKNEAGTSYYEFLQHVKTLIK